MHPWITGNLDDKIPLSYKERFNVEVPVFEVSDKFRRSLN